MQLNVIFEKGVHKSSLKHWNIEFFYLQQLMQLRICLFVLFFKLKRVETKLIYC